MRTKNMRLATFKLNLVWMVASAVVPLLVAGSRFPGNQELYPQTIRPSDQPR